ncbi:MAG: hypothetical protein JNM27_11510 [Leptospirales bacterium]|nr:hypothetical protein [Leptospirales bacterium]
MRKIVYGLIFLIGFFGITACGLLVGKKDKEDNTLTLLLILAALRGNSGSSCSNQSGLVICIPPGVPL